jgi:diguanylate cyclase (GGDEF)-like protein
LIEFAEKVEAVKVLLVDDNRGDLSMLEYLARSWGYEPTMCSDPAEVWRIIQEPDAPRLVVLDWMMPGVDGLEICRKIREQSAVDYTYVILVSGKTLKEDAVAALKAGADDFITKPFYPEEMELRLRVGRRVLELLESLLAAQMALNHQASQDALTGLWNRTAILNTLGKELNRVARENQSVSIIMIDIDHFKTINDTHGHLCGDQVLREVAQRMLASIRSYDSLGRMGGDEFLLVAPSGDHKSLKMLAERIRAGIGDAEIDTTECKISVTVSLGTATAPKGSSMKVEELIRAADKSLYQAKRRGRNRVRMGWVDDPR